MRAGVFCDKDFCQCEDCENTETSQVVRGVILATKLKDPTAFDPKVCASLAMSSHYIPIFAALLPFCLSLLHWL